MDREQVIATLRGHEGELRAFGVIRLSLFGSTARGDQRPDSDIDLLAAFDNTRRLSILDVAGIEQKISQMLGRPVELVEETTLKPRVRTNVESEAVRPSKDPVQRFEDILENVLLVEEFTRGMDLRTFLDDLKTRNATERCMEQISEAARKLGELAENVCPGIPWANLRALGNFLRHEYDRVDPARLWVMIQDDLGPLKAAAQRALEQLRQTED